MDREGIEYLEEAISLIERIANHYYSPNDKGWKVLLGCRDKLNIFLLDLEGK